MFYFLKQVSFINTENLIFIMVEENKDQIPTENAQKTEKSAPLKVESAKKGTSVNKKNSSKKSAHKKAVSHENSVSHTAGKNKEVPWKLVTIILAVVMLLLIAVVAAMSLVKNGESEEKIQNTTSSTTTNSNIPSSNSTEPIELLIIEDPTCTSCQVDLFVTQVKANLIPTLQVKKISIETAEGKKLLVDLKATQVPIYLFGNNIDKRDDWVSNLAGAFEKINVNSKDYYMLNPQFVQNKVMIEEPKITSTAVVYGKKDAKVTIYVFSDYECPFCAIAEGNAELVTQFSAQTPGYVPTMPNVYKDYVDKGLVKVVFYNMPLEQLHPQSKIAHLASLCANEQGKWYEFHSNLFEKRSDWINDADKASKYKGYAKTLGVDTTKFNDCLDTKKYDSQIESELALGASYGVSGTPAFFIGKNFISGAQEYSTVKTIIDAELAK